MIKGHISQASPLMLVVLVLISAWSLPVHSQPWLPPVKADIQPKDSLAFIGETLKLECALLDAAKGVNSSDMYFTVTAGIQTWRIPRENTTIIGSKNISVQCDITEEFLKENTFTCRTENEILRSVTFYVERPLMNVTNFGGVALYDKSIQVSWDLGQDYLGNIRVVTDWSPAAPPNLNGNNCSSDTKKNCTIDNYAGQEIIFFRVMVKINPSITRPSEEYLTPLFEMNATSVHKFVVVDHRKTSPPSRFRVVSTTNNCMNFTWDDPLYFSHCPPPCNARYELNVTKKAREEGVVPKISTGERYTDEIQICDLTPYTTYEVSVRVRANDINPWSDEVFTEGKTEEDRPLNGPPLTETSYYVGDCKDNKKELFLYWNDPKTETMRGQLTEYIVAVDGRNETLRAGSNYFKCDLNCESTFDISVFAATKFGTSLTPSTVQIPVEHDAIPVSNDMDFLVQERLSPQEKLNVSITWDPDLAGEENVSLVFYLCQEAYIDYTCLNDFDFVTGLDSGSISREDLNGTDYLYGYALMSSSGRKRGIQWADCVYNPGRKPDKPTGVSVTRGEDSTSLRISWTATRCNRDKKVLVLRYHIYICENTQNLTDCKNDTVSSRRGQGENEYTATGLSRGKKYIVHVQSESPAGLGPPSDPATFTPASSSSLEIGELVGIAMLVMVALIVLSVGILVIARRCWKSRKRYKALIESSPSILENVSQNPSLQSSESGFGGSGSQNSSRQERPNTPPPLPDLPARGLQPHNLQETPETQSAAVEAESVDVDIPNKLVEAQIPNQPAEVHDPGNFAMNNNDEATNKSGYVTDMFAARNGSHDYMRVALDNSHQDRPDHGRQTFGQSANVEGWQNQNGVTNLGETLSALNKDKGKTLASLKVAENKGVDGGSLNEKDRESVTDEGYSGSPETVEGEPEFSQSQTQLPLPVHREPVGSSASVLYVLVDQNCNINGIAQVHGKVSDDNVDHSQIPCQNPSPKDQEAMVELLELHGHEKDEPSNLLSSDSNSHVPDYVTCACSGKTSSEAESCVSHDSHKPSANLQDNSDTCYGQGSPADAACDLESQYHTYEQGITIEGKQEVSVGVHDDYVRQALSGDPQGGGQTSKASIEDAGQDNYIAIGQCEDMAVKQQPMSLGLNEVEADTSSSSSPPLSSVITSSTSGSSCDRPDLGYVPLDAMQRLEAHRNVCSGSGAEDDPEYKGMDFSMNTSSSTVSDSDQDDKISTKSVETDNDYQPVETLLKNSMKFDHSSELIAEKADAQVEHKSQDYEIREAGGSENSSQTPTAEASQNLSSPTTSGNQNLVNGDIPQTEELLDPAESSGYISVEKMVNMTTHL